MPTREELYAEIGERNRRAHRQDRRDVRWFWLKVLLACFAWALAGLVLGAWAFHVTDPELGHILLTAGQLVTGVGVLGTVTWALRKSESRGW
jgi:membrane protein DedA with SNARE-associated domain